MVHGRNDPCYCGSGMKFKHCHYLIDSAPPEKRVQVTQEQYSRSWERNANHYRNEGVYSWIVDQVAEYEPKVILDVGCGNGQGLLELCSHFPQSKVISLEENKSCVENAVKLLTDHEFPPTIVRRIQHVLVAPEIHDLLISDEIFSLDERISIVEGDILLDDDFLLKSLINAGPYDLITVWMVGTHLSRGECRNIASLRIKNSGEYRLYVQNKVYKIADRLLKSGGILQVVDRGEPPDSDLIKNDFLRGHRDQASVTTLDVIKLEYREYTEPDGKQSVQMIKTLGLSGRDFDMSRKAVISTISVKP